MRSHRFHRGYVLESDNPEGDGGGISGYPLLYLINDILEDIEGVLESSLDGYIAFLDDDFSGDILSFTISVGVSEVEVPINCRLGIVRGIDTVTVDFLGLSSGDFVRDVSVGGVGVYDLPRFVLSSMLSFLKEMDGK